MEIIHFSAILLAGGKSKRMGQDKAFLIVNGKSFLTLQAEKLFSVGADEVLISGPYALSRCRAVPDEYEDRGPLGGLYTCLKAASHDICLVLSVDMPLVDEILLKSMVHAFAASSADALILSHEGQIEPLVGVYRKSLFSHIEPLIREKSASVRALLQIIQTDYYDYNGPAQSLLNCNKPGDYERLNSIIRR